MAKSSAKKKIEHRLRQNSNAFDPRKNRGSWGNVKPIARIKQGKRRQEVMIDDEAVW